MSKVFKIGSIADIINSQTSDKRKKSKVAKRFGKVIEESKDREIEINRDVTPPEDNDDSESNHSDESKTEEVGEDVEEEVTSTTETKKRDEEKSERTIFVGNLPKTVTEKLLRRLFLKFGLIQSIRFRGAVPEDEKISKKVAVITKKFHNKVDSIQAYIVFKTKDSVSDSLQMNGTLVDGHHIRVDIVSKTTSYDNSRTIFVGNIPFVTKDDELYEFFKEFGDIEAVRVVRDTRTGIGKGFAFVLFKSKDSVILALEKNEMEFKGRELRVKRIETKKNEKKRKNINDTKDTPTLKKPKVSNKKSKKSDTNTDFKGIAAKKLKKKFKKKKEMKAIIAKKKQRNMSQIFAK